MTILYNNNENVFIYFRYKANRAILREELNKLGFKQLVPEKNAGYIITSYLCPKHPNFSFKQFYSKLSDKGICIDLLMYKHHVLIFIINDSIIIQVLTCNYESRYISYMFRYQFITFKAFLF